MVEFRNLVVRSPRRVRLEFSSALAAGAFDPSWFTIVCEDSVTGDPGVLAALAVPTLDSYVELALALDLGPGAQYTLHVAAGVPALDASTGAAATQLFYAPLGQLAPSVGVSAKNQRDVVFQEDIAHDPVKGHLLAPDHDLATVSGPDNAKATLVRGVTSSGLPHRRGWGANLGDDVDLPSPMLPTLRGKLERQIRRDDRVANCRVSAEEGDDGAVFLVGSVDMIGQVQSNLKERVNARG